MEKHDLSDFIKMLMGKKNLSLEKVAERLFITKQGFHKWIHKRKNVNWKIESLLTLSELLEFDLFISRGKLYVKESEIMELKNGNVDVKHFDVNLEAHVPLSVENNKVDYEVCKELKDHSIVKLYVSNTGINDDIEPTLLEGLYDCYNTKEECLNNEYASSAIEVYTLLDNKSGVIEQYS